MQFYQMESFFFLNAQRWTVISCYEGYFTPVVIDLIIYVSASSNKSRFYLESIWGEEKVIKFLQISKADVMKSFSSILYSSLLNVASIWFRMF